MTTTWLAGLIRRRPTRLVGAAVGVAIAVALLASLGAFLAHSRATMTSRAVRGVAVDWQVQLSPGADPVTAARTVEHSVGVRASRVVGYAATSGLTARTGGSTQSTSAGVVLGLAPGYVSSFPQQLRRLSGSLQGALLYQQTASNLHGVPGTSVAIGRSGLAPAHVTVTGVVDLPQINSLFQQVGAPIGSQPAAPPDNVVLLPLRQWHELFDPLARSRPDLVMTQLHVLRTHRLPADPAAAYAADTAQAHNLEARSAGTLVVGDNLGTALDAARADAAYAQILFLFLGLPGAIVAAMLTATVASAAAQRRRAEQALLRARGASSRRLLRLAAAEAAIIGTTGAIAGVVVALIIGRTVFHTAGFGATTSSALGWTIGSAVAGLLIAAAAVLVPARRDLLASTVAAGRMSLSRNRYPWWGRAGDDVVLLVIAYLVYAATSRNGYQLVLAPEGVAMISVSYWAFLGPALLWIGSGLLVWRLCDLVLGPGRPLLRRLLRPLTGRLSGPVAGTISRQRRPLVRAVVLLTLALSFAASNAIFDATYRQQAEADAQLTNGADVTVTASPGRALGPRFASRLARVSGVKGVEPVQHRYAYIGSDLQDLYGVRPGHIRSATALQDSYFQGGSAASLMHTLHTRPDSILVSAETVKDYQLHPGDLIRLRLVDAHTAQPRTVAFHYVGIVTEFPTAPKDSFFVANAAYIAQQTRSSAVGAFLINTGGQGSSAVASRVQALLGPDVRVTDVATVRGQVGSSLTSVDLSGLAGVELVFALVLAAGTGGLVLALSLAERRRSFAIVTALGGRRRHLRAMIASETVVVALLGMLGGAVLGIILSRMLVKVLTGVFDPAPSVVATPWRYLLALVAVTIVAYATAAMAAARDARRPALTVLRDL